MKSQECHLRKRVIHSFLFGQEGITAIPCTASELGFEEKTGSYKVNMVRNVPVVALVVLASIYGPVVNGEVVNGEEAENPCEKGIDLGIIVDRSKSVGKDNYKKVKEDLKIFVDNFNITPETTHTSLIFYADKAQHWYNLSDSRYHSNEAVKKKIDSISNRLIWGTRTDLALMKAHDELFNNGHDRKRKPSVLVVFTDGKTSSSSAPYSETVPPLEDKGVNIIAVGIGKGIRKSELRQIAGERGSVVQVPDFDALAGKLNEIVAQVCIINGGYTTWSEWSECSVTCGNGTRMRSRNCTNPEPMGGGKNCDEIGPPDEHEACALPECDESIDGGYSRWTTWTQCSKDCGGGMRIRVRACTNPAPYLNGKTCDHIGEPQETVACNTKPCKVLPAPCDQGIDLGILIDRSKSIVKRNVERLLKVFMPSFLSKFTISRRKTHIGLVMYSKDAVHLAPFNGKTSRSGRRAKAFFARLDPTTSFQTRTDKGLMTAYSELFTKKNGDRRKNQNVLLTFTDGRAFPKRRIRPFTETVPPLKSKKKCHMVAVGYGVPSKINMTQLKEIGGDNVVKVTKPRQVKKWVKKIKKIVCRVDGGYSEWSMWSMCSSTCGAGLKVRSRVCNSPPRRGGKDCKRLGKPYETVECNEGECSTEPTPCNNQKLDVCLIVDASLSVGLPNFVRVKTFLIQFIHQFDPDTHFSIITFAKTPTVQCKFSDSQCQTTDGTHDLISEIPNKLRWGTFTDKAFAAADQTVYTSENGDRADANNLVVCITDGKTMKGSAPFNVTVPPLRDGKRAKVIAFGVGPSIREEDLNEMAGEKNWFYVDNFFHMSERIPDILETACNKTAPTA